MSTRDLLGFFIAPIALIFTGWAIKEHALWSTLASATVPWFCTALALAMLVVGSTCTLLQCSPARIPAGRAAAVAAVVLVAIGVGLGVDAVAYNGARDLVASIGEWLGFAVLLGVVFWLPRVSPAESLT